MNIYNKTRKEFNESEIFPFYCFLAFIGLLFLVGIIINCLKAV